MKILFAALLTLLSSGCAHREFTTADGVKIKSTTFLIVSKMDTVTVSTNGLTIGGYAGKPDMEAMEALFTAAFKAGLKATTGK